MVGQEILVLFIMVRIRVLQPNKNSPQGAFLFGASRGLCKRFIVCTAKHYQCFVRILSQNASGGIPTPLCVLQPIYIAFYEDF